MIRIKKQSPLLQELTTLPVGGYIDCCTESITGNALSAKIAMWVKANKLEGRFSRRTLNTNTTRIFRVQ